MRPREQFDLSALRTIGSTGSPLTEESYRWIYAQVHPDVLLASISGGTDPGCAFLTACPILPVYAGEMQCRTLGGRAYPYALHRAHEVAVIQLDEKNQLISLIQAELNRNGMEIGDASHKQGVKDISGKRTRYG